MSSWITFDTTGGTGNTTIIITAASSTELNYRIKTLRAETTSHRKTANVVVTQEKYILQLSASTDYLYFSGDTGETQEVCVFSNTAWTATASESWIHLSKSGSTGEDCFNVTTDGLTGDDIRWGEISITDGENTVVVFVVQSGDDYHHFIGVFESGEGTFLYRGYDYDWDRDVMVRIDKGEWESVLPYVYNTNNNPSPLHEGRHVVEYDFVYDPYPSSSPSYDNDTIYNGAFLIGPGMSENDIPLAFGIVTDGYVNVGGSSFANRFLKKIELRSNTLTGIGGAAFGGVDYNATPQSHAKLKDVTIPSSVETIGNGAFAWCTSLTSVTFAGNSNLLIVPDDCFRNCNNLLSVGAIPDSVLTIGARAFQSCAALDDVFFTSGSSCYSIGSSAFSNTNITALTVPETMRVLGSGAFAGSKLASFDYPEYVCEIADEMFKGCSNLTYIHIPKDVDTVGDDVFKDCTALDAIRIEAIDCPITTTNPFTNIKSGGTLYYPSCANYSLWLTYLGNSWQGNPNVSCVGETLRVVPSSFNIFPSSGGSYIMEIYTNYKWEAEIVNDSYGTFSVVPSSGIGSWQVALNVEPNNSSSERSAILRIKTAHSNSGDIVLRQELDITSLPTIKVTLNINDTTQPITISSGDTGATIYKYRIDFGEWLTKDTASTIDYQFDYNGTHLVEYALKITTTDSCILPTDRTLVRGIELDDNIISLSNGFAQNCTNLLMFIMSSAITHIPSYCFKNCGAINDYSYILHSGITRIDTEAFSYNSFSSSTLNLTNVTSMGTGAFESCSGFSTVIIDHLNTIPDRAFMCCYDLSNVEWKTNCSEIGEYAFYTTALFSNGNKTITLPITGDYNPPTIGAYAFANSVGWSSPDVDVDLRFPVYMSRDRSSTACTIGEGAFSNTYIQSVSFYKVPDSPYNGTPIFAFPTKCFKDCRSLERINVENTNTTISAMSNDTFQNVASNGVLHYKSSYGCSSITNNNPYHLGYYGWTAVRDL